MTPPLSGSAETEEPKGSRVVLSRCPGGAGGSAGEGRRQAGEGEHLRHLQDEDGEGPNGNFQAYDPLDFLLDSGPYVTVKVGAYCCFGLNGHKMPIRNTLQGFDGGC